MTGPDGAPLFIHADQLEVSPDGTWLYYQPCSGGLSRIATRYLDDPALRADALHQHVEHFADTPTTGGTAIDAKGNIYLSDTEKLRVYKITPAGKVSTLVADPRLDWVDAMWIDASGTLWMPSPQIDRQAPFNNGVSRVQRPFEVFTMSIGEKPPANDHR